MYDAIVVGGGPIGLASALMLGGSGFKVLVAEQRSAPNPGSRAIGITPPSLAFLETLGIADSLIQAGVPISEVQVDNHRGILGKVSFTQLPAPYRFILSLAQNTTEAILASALAACPSVTVWPGSRLVSLAETAGGVEAQFADNAPGAAGPARAATGRWLLGCDGVDSATRRLAGLDYPGQRYSDTFVMGDFRDTTGFGQIARLWFTPDGAVESFPLPGGQRRWITQTRSFVANPDPELITRTVARRTGLDIGAANLTWQSPFGVRRNLASRYRRGRILLLGDAAHCLSPIGGQGMNTGFADVAGLLPLVMADVDDAKSWRGAEAMRRRAFTIAANRAWRSMRLGTVLGQPQAWFRDRVLWLMLNGPFRSRVPLDYAMLTIPASGTPK